MRVEMIFRRVCAQPAHRRLAIMNLRGPRRDLAQAVADVRHGVVGTQKLQRGAGTILAACPPGAAVNPDEERLWRVAGRKMQIEL